MERVLQLFQEDLLTVSSGPKDRQLVSFSHVRTSGGHGSAEAWDASEAASILGASSKHMES